MAAKSCHERALGLLAVRQRTRWEMQQRLRQGGFDDGEVQDVLERLERVGLIDDREFAESFAQQRFEVKRVGARAVQRELRAKGVSPELVAAVTDRELGDEASRARDLALTQLGRLHGLEVAKAFSRLNSLLQRRGYAPEVARWAARVALRESGSQDAGLASDPLGP